MRRRVRKARRPARGPASPDDDRRRALEIAANVGARREAAEAVELGAEGVGLLRTEFLFLDRDDAPDRGRAARRLRGDRRRARRPAADRPHARRRRRQAAAVPRARSPRTTRSSACAGSASALAQPGPAAHAAARDPRASRPSTRVTVMFPMVATLGEFRAARALLDGARRARRPPIEVGIMVEVPAVAVAADALRARGRLLLDRHERPRPVHAGRRARQRGARAAARRGPQPAVLRLIATRRRAAAGAHGRWVGVCGELAGDPAAAVLLAGLGVAELSMAPSRIPEVKEALRALDARGGAGDRAPGARLRRRAGRRRRAEPRRPVASGRLVSTPRRAGGGVRSARFLAAGTTLRIVLTPVSWRSCSAAATAASLAARAVLPSPPRPTTSTAASRAAGIVTTKLGSFLDTTADKLLVTGVLIALVAVERASPWIAASSSAASSSSSACAAWSPPSGAVMAAVACWASSRRPSSSLAILLAILRPGDPIGGLYLDEWAMLVAAAITVMVGGRLPRALRVRRSPTRPRRMTRASSSPAAAGSSAARWWRGLVERGDEVVALARSDAAAAELEAHGARRGARRRARRGRAGGRRCAAASSSTTSPASTRSARPTRRALFHVNVRGAEAAVRAAPAPACGASCSPRRRPRSARPRAPSAARTRRTAARTCRSTSAPSTRASWRRSRRRGAPGSSSSSVNPSSVQGPGRAGGTGRILIAYLNGRLKAFVDTRISLVDIGDCVEGHLLAAERGAAGRALRAQRRDAHLAARRSSSSRA